MKNILIIGSINIDLVINTDILPKLGETVHGKNFMTSYGGKGANQAVAVAKLYGKADMIGAVGNDEFGKLLKTNLENQAIRTKGVKIADTNSGVAVITVCGGDNHIILDGGANDTVTPAWIDKNIDLIQNADIVIFQLEIPMETILYAAKKSKACGCKVLLNPAPAAKLPEELLEYCDIIVPNEHEAAIITGYDDEETALKALWNNGKRSVIITLGNKGCLYNEGLTIKRQQAFPIKAIDSTAAGDSFIGGYCSAVAEGKSMDEAIRFATAVSAITVSRSGAGASIPTREEAETFLKKQLH
ncbi:MAG: ribokinase [Clostridia bacterium]|nr:ribokinase [Clostridia bacterium]